MEVQVFDPSSARDPSFAINDVKHLVHRSANYDLVAADEAEAERVKAAITSLEAQIRDTIPTLGSQHPKTLALYSQLGMVFSNAGYFAEAERIIHRAWEGRKIAHGERHMKVFLEQTNLAGVLFKLRRYVEAYDNYTQALAGLESLFGKNNDVLLETLAGLGKTAQAQNLLKEAEVCYNRIYLYHVHNNGPEAEITLASGNQLAAIYKDQAYYNLADQLCTQVLADATRLLGEQHAVTQQAIEIMARIRVGEGRGEQAELMYRRSLEYQERVFGFDGAPTIHTVSSIGQLLWDRGDSHNAEVMFSRALDSLIRTEGELHDLTLSAMHSLGAMLYEIERVREGEVLLRKNWVGRKKTLGIMNEKTLNAAFSLAKALNVTAEWKHEPDYPQKLLECEELLRLAVDSRDQMLGSVHSDTTDSIIYLADFLLEHTRYEESLREYERVYATYKGEYGVDDVRTGRAAYGIGACMQYLRRYADAAPFFDEAHKAYMKAWGSDTSHSALANRHRLAIVDALQMFTYTKKRSKQSEYDKRVMPKMFQ